MTEIFEFRIVYEFAHLLFRADEGKDLGQITKSIKVVRLTKEDSRFYEIPIIANQIREKYNKNFFFGWGIIRKYNKKELETAKLLHLKIDTVFEPTGEECGTLYDESTSCEICGANGQQVGLLKLKKGSIPKKDISKTIGGEIVVSDKFVKAVQFRNIRGIKFEHIYFSNEISNYYQLIVSEQTELSKMTIAGVNPFDLSENSSQGESILLGEHNIKFEKEVYKCPKGHTIGLNILSEPYVIDSVILKDVDFFKSKQMLGIRRGLLRQEPLYFASQSFRQMVIEEQLSGFEFEISNIVK